jgi:hypothetical protein
MLAHFTCLVEGKGEVAAVPVLLRRIAARIDSSLALQITTARVARNQIVQPNVLESWVQRAAVTTPMRRNDRSASFVCAASAAPAASFRNTSFAAGVAKRSSTSIARMARRRSTDGRPSFASNASARRLISNVGDPLRVFFIGHNY